MNESEHFAQFVQVGGFVGFFLFLCWVILKLATRKSSEKRVNMPVSSSNTSGGTSSLETGLPPSSATEITIPNPIPQSRDLNEEHKWRIPNPIFWDAWGILLTLISLLGGLAGMAMRSNPDELLNRFAVISGSLSLFFLGLALIFAARLFSIGLLILLRLEALERALSPDAGTRGEVDENEDRPS